MSTITPCLRYRDAARAVDWLCEAFGFEQHMVIQGEGGAIAHAELGLGDDFVMVGSERDDVYGGRTGGGWCYVVVEDADAHCERARAAGAEILTEPYGAEHGSRDYAARDFEGNIWNFGTYRPGGR